MVESRFQKLVGMAPQVLRSPTKPRKMVYDMNHDELRSSLSPLSSGKVHQLEAPTKKGLAEYDRSMNTVQNAVRKSLKACTGMVDKVKEQEERERARLQKLEEAKQKSDQRRARALAKAREDGIDQAGKELVEQGDAPECDEHDVGDEESDGENLAWRLLEKASELLSTANSNLCQILSTNRLNFNYR